MHTDKTTQSVRPTGTVYTQTGFNDQFGWGGITQNTPKAAPPGNETKEARNPKMAQTFLDYSRKVDDEFCAVWPLEGSLANTLRYGMGEYDKHVYQEHYHRRCRDQLTGLPTPIRKPPPFILMRPTANDEHSLNVQWSLHVINTHAKSSTYQ
jgi:hypothetical protein